MMPAPGDIFLLCTDGLHGELDDTSISRLLHDSGRDLGAASRALVDAALEAGGHDNVTAVLVEV
jgi:protein phosphatase